jgi:hypothetical protein
MGKTAVAIELSESERRELGGLASRRKTAQGLAQRARIILLAAEGLENKDISLRVEAAPNTVSGASPSHPRGRSRMLESGSSGSVRGASSNGRPYREPRPYPLVRP